jgi:hypothetical protein
MRPDTLDFIARDEAFAQHCEASPDQHCNFQLTGGRLHVSRG